MNRAALLDGTLRRLMEDGRMPSPAPPESADSFAWSVHSLDLNWLGLFEDAGRAARNAGTTAEDRDAHALARAAAGLAIAGWAGALDDRTLLDSDSDGDPLGAALEDSRPLAPELAGALNALLAEASLACARLGLAERFVERAGPPPPALFGDPRHPFLTFHRTMAARVAAFRGDITTAKTFAESAVERASDGLESVFAEATAALVLGNADDRAGTLAIVDRVAEGDVEPGTITSRGCFVLAAYGAIALGDTDRAVRLMLTAGEDADLGRLRIIDRVLGLEMLVVAAVEADDLDAANAWATRAEPLAAHPIATSTVARIQSRVALLAGDADLSLVMATRAVVAARVESRTIEAAEAEILVARAQLARRKRADAVRSLSRLANGADDTGHRAVRRSASRELRSVGRRLTPRPTSGWDGLSNRERQVALLVAEGLSNQQLARQLYLSEHTVRIHVSRVLQAFGVATRAGVVAALAVQEPASASVPALEPAPLTAQQRRIVEQIVAGATNQQIADELGIGITTVEKHVHEVLRRWEVGSRAGIVRIALSTAAEPGK